ncbi:MAG: hypothetical protein ACJA08_001121 [Cyclobacteriaceae bacterium]|jgi:uncharacterized protein YjiK
MNDLKHLLKSIAIVLSLTLNGVLQLSCNFSTSGSQEKSQLLITDHLKVTYDLLDPLEKHFLPYALTEISGLTYLKSGRLLCVEDERGKVYEYDLGKREVVKTEKFWDSGDYEGIEIVDSKAYVLESDGDIYSFDYLRNDASKTKKFETRLTSENNTEGLAYDPTSNSLLIACKAKGNIKGQDQKGKGIYSFELESKRFNEEAVFDIRIKDIINFIEDNREITLREKSLEFKPSGIAINPVDDLIYIISSAGKLMIVLSREGKIKGTYPLDPKIFTQPEGICFAPNGDLYISSEGRGAKGYILEFKASIK